MTIAHPLNGKRILIIGLGLSGQAAARFLLRRKAKVMGADRNLQLLNSDVNIVDLRSLGLEVCPDNESCDLSTYDLVVVSPGIPQTHPYYVQAKACGIEIIGEVELACRDISQTCVGITGTNGKTTVTLLVTHIMNCAGRKALALGNVGLPLTSAVDEAINNHIDTYVIELSSFQLETLKRPFLDAGVLLNITPDHLDRYATLQDYARAKISLSKNIKTNGMFFVEDKCLNEFKPLFREIKNQTYGYSDKCPIYTDGHDVFVGEQKAFSLPGPYKKKCSHDVENIMAAFALCNALGISNQDFLSGLETFKKPHHRIEFIRTISNVEYYDDSKGTNIDAVIRAVETLGGPIVLIAGGVDKGFPYTQWVKAFDGHVKCLCAIGQSASKIKADIGHSIPVHLFDTLENATRYASSMACSGDKVLLSPGCSSYDMFKDYVHRGNEFQRIVNSFIEG